MPSRSLLCRATARVLLATLLATLEPIPADASLSATSLAVSKGLAGNRTQITEHDGSVRTYGYDELYRLTSDTVTIGALNQYSKGFTYDDVGNRQTQTTTIGPAGSPGVLVAGTLTYGYDERDRLTSETLGANPPTTYGWDADGNLTTKSGEATYAWDRENRLVRVTKTDGTVVENTYDFDGTRVKTVTTPASGPASTTNFLVDTSGSLSNVVAETKATGEAVAHYVRGDDLLSVMRPLVAAPASPGDWQTRYYHADHIGSVRRLTNEAGTITDGYTYSAFGELLAHTGSDPQPYAFTGEPYDPNVGFQYHRARWMDPRVGRFVNVDPLRGSPYDPAALHRYAYAAGDPVNRIDPSGKEFTLTTALTAIGLGLTIAQMTVAYIHDGAGAAAREGAIGLALTLGPLALIRAFAWIGRAIHLLRIARSAELTFDVAVQTAGTGERVAGFTIYGVKGLAWGRTYVRSIVLIQAESPGAVPLSQLLAAMEAEAIAAGATELRIVGHAIIETRLLSPTIAARYGYQFNRLADDTFEIVKILVP